MSVTAFAIALVAATPLADAPVAQLQAAPEGDLAAQTLAAGREDEALAVLQRAVAANPHDPAVLINLGIAYAHKGEDAKARTAFEAALTCHEVVELDTADGTATDSRRLARKAIRMLERGEFRSGPARGEQLTYRD
ncbi:tetratricopeptide repeat protein [Erythrobacter dokdonensis]|uniref:TPR repeat-containing protein n=1 Tax=Erythrobacter dokdonensis DSW-74 TaxID=1300349 RepID=A0A1A7BFE9_9SPHN|nr:tetratricopeptide repeat protein [Erythrobacter dokdonensis]MEE4316960.1 tetratricopeptide repeat protein [Erythrobacter sp.]OBV10471.1 TPR repeat-containing protein [Erythrobacter dokdonensis DSW-74]